MQAQEGGYPMRSVLARNFEEKLCGAAGHAQCAAGFAFGAPDFAAVLPNKRGYGIVCLKAKRKVQNLLLRNDWEETAFRSTNGALNLRRSLIEDVLTSGGCYDQ